MNHSTATGQHVTQQAETRDAADEHVQCEVCHGSGAIPDTFPSTGMRAGIGLVDCAACNGRGWNYQDEE